MCKKLICPSRTRTGVEVVHLEVEIKVEIWREEGAWVGPPPLVRSGGLPGLMSTQIHTGGERSLIKPTSCKKGCPPRRVVFRSLESVCLSEPPVHPETILSEVCRLGLRDYAYRAPNNRFSVF